MAAQRHSQRNGATLCASPGARRPPTEHGQVLGTGREETDSGTLVGGVQASPHISPPGESGLVDMSQVRRHGHELATWAAKASQAARRHRRPMHKYSVQQAGFLVLKGGRGRALDVVEEQLHHQPAHRQAAHVPRITSSSWPRPSSGRGNYFGHSTAAGANRSSVFFGSPSQTSGTARASKALASASPSTFTYNLKATALAGAARCASGYEGSHAHERTPSWARLGRA